MKKIPSGFIDPVSLITLGFLVVGLVVTTVIVKNPDKLDIRKQAAVGSLCRAEGGKCVAQNETCKSTLSVVNDCGSGKKCGVDCGSGTPSPTAVPKGNSCEDNGGVECDADEEECKGRELKEYSTKKNLCCEETKGCKNKPTPPPSPSPSPTPSDSRPNLCEPECSSSDECVSGLGPAYYCQIIDQCTASCVRKSTICTLGTSRCLGNTLEACTDEGTAWSGSACPSGTTCNAGAGICERTGGSQTSICESECSKDADCTAKLGKNAYCEIKSSCGSCKIKQLLPSPSPAVITQSDYDKCLADGNSPSECSSIAANLGQTITTPAGKTECDPNKDKPFCSGNNLKICSTSSGTWGLTTCQYGCENSACKAAPTVSAKETALVTTYNVLDTVTFGAFGNYVQTYQDINAQNPQSSKWERAFNPEGVAASAQLGVILTAEGVAAVTGLQAVAGGVAAGSAALSAGAGAGQAVLTAAGSTIPGLAFAGSTVQMGTSYSGAIGVCTADKDSPECKTALAQATLATANFATAGMSSYAQSAVQAGTITAGQMTAARAANAIVTIPNVASQIPGAVEACRNDPFSAACLIQGGSTLLTAAGGISDAIYTGGQVKNWANSQIDEISNFGHLTNAPDMKGSTLGEILNPETQIVFRRTKNPDNIQLANMLRREIPGDYSSNINLPPIDSPQYQQAVLNYAANSTPQTFQAVVDAAPPLIKGQLLSPEKTFRTNMTTFPEKLQAMHYDTINGILYTSPFVSATTDPAFFTGNHGYVLSPTVINILVAEVPTARLTKFTAIGSLGEVGIHGLIYPDEIIGSFNASGMTLDQLYQQTINLLSQP